MEHAILGNHFRKVAVGAALIAAAALYVVILDSGTGGPATVEPPAKRDEHTAPVAAIPIAVASVPAALNPVPAAEQAPVVATVTPDAPSKKMQVLNAATLRNSQGQDWLVGTLDSNPKVLVIRFPNLADQARTMNRLAAYVEKSSAPRNRLLTDSELSKVIAAAGDSPETFYLGHDYRFTEVARFYNQALQQQLKLQPAEQRLLSTLEEAGYIKKRAKYEGDTDNQALITVSGLTKSDLQRMHVPANDLALGDAILVHEISHGEYLTNANYRKQCWHFWKAMLTEKERLNWTMLLKHMGYDVSNEDLLVNEMQALLMHTPDPRFFSAEHLSISEQDLARQRVRFTQAGKDISQ